MSVAVVKAILRQSFNIAPPTLTETNLPDQTGRVILITGGYAGVGQELSRILYQHNATIYIAGRSSQKAETSIAATKSLFPSSKGRLEFLHLDLADLSTVKGAAEEFLKKEEKLDVLVNNAGVMIPPKGSVTAQGHELQAGTNVLGPWLFTHLLTGILEKTAEAAPERSVRVLWAGSLAVEAMSPKGGVQFDEGGGLKVFGNQQTNYGQSKVANLFLARAFGHKVEERWGGKILSVAFNPGNLETELQRHTLGLVRTIGKWVMLWPAKFGGYTELWAGWGDFGDAKGKGKDVYVVPWGQNDWNRIRSDVLKALEEGKEPERLWGWCEKETKQFQ